MFDEVSRFLETGKGSLREALAHFHKSPDWYYRWKKKKEQGDIADHRGWKKGKARRFTKGLSNEVCKIRDHLEKTHTFWDAQAVLEELRKTRKRSIPSIHYVKKILQARGKTKGRFSSRTADERTYPTSLFPENVLRIGVDLWGPKTIQGVTEKAVAACLSFFGGEKALVPLPDASTTAFLDAEWKFIKETGRIPFYVLSDNGSQLLGNTDGLPDFGRHLRLWMNLGVVPIFVPEHQPWRNGVAESVNGVWKKKYWGRKRYGDLKGVHADMLTFSKHMSERHVKAQQVPMLESPMAEVSRERISRRITVRPFTRRLFRDANPYVLFIRPVRFDEDGQRAFISMPGGPFIMKKEWIGIYVVAVVNVRENSVSVWYEQEKGLFTRITQRPFPCTI